MSLPEAGAHAGGAPPTSQQSSGGAGEAAAGAGEAAAGAPCQDDEECANGFACDGEERCTESGCEQGEAVTCSAGTSCEESSEELCVYTQRSPWLVISAVDKLLGLPAALLGKEPLIELGSRQRTDAWTGFDECSWSPDGTLLIARAAEVQLGYGFGYARVGAGLPSALRNLPEFPSWSAGPRWIDEFSPDSHYFFLADVDTGGFLFDVTDREPTPRLLDASSITFCDAAATWIAGDEIQELSGDALSSRLLPRGPFTISTDRRLIAVERRDEDDEAVGVTLTPCGMEEWTAELPGEFPRFSDDTKFVWVDVDYESSLFSIEDPRAPVELLSAEESGLELRQEISPNGQYVVAVGDEGLMMVDVRGGNLQTPTPLNMSEHVEIVQLRDDGVLAWSTYESSQPRDLLWQPLPPLASPITLHHDPKGADALHLEVRPGQLWIESDDGSKSRLYRVDLNVDTPTAELLITLPVSVTKWVPAPDGSGVAIGVLTGTLTQSAYWAPFNVEGTLEEPVLLSETGYAMSFQPWP